MHQNFFSKVSQLLTPCELLVLIAIWQGEANSQKFKQTRLLLSPSEDDRKQQGLLHQMRSILFKQWRMAWLILSKTIWNLLRTPLPSSKLEANRQVDMQMAGAKCGLMMRGASA